MSSAFGKKLFSQFSCFSSLNTYRNIIPQSNKFNLHQIYVRNLSGSTNGSSKSFNPIRDYKQLSKLRLSALVTFTASAGFIAGSGESIDWWKFLWTNLGTFGAAACANTLNQLYEIHNDKLMTRTWNRPLPTGRIGRLHAALFALVCGATGIYILNETTNSLTALLGVTNILLYAGMYTPLKQVTIWNTWVGAVVGAVPPLMGWAAASGGLDVGATILASMLFSWQIPHFLALAWLCKDDYFRGGFRMMPFLDPAGRRTATAAVRHCVYLLPLGYVAYLAGMATEPFAWEAGLLTAGMGFRAVQFYNNPVQSSARSLFRISLLYLPLLMVCLIVHRLPHTNTQDISSRLPLLSLSIPNNTLTSNNISTSFESPVTTHSSTLSEAPIGSCRNPTCHVAVDGATTSSDIHTTRVPNSKDPMRRAATLAAMNAAAGIDDEDELDRQFNGARGGGKEGKGKEGEENKGEGIFFPSFVAESVLRWMINVSGMSRTVIEAIICNTFDAAYALSKATGLVSVSQWIQDLEREIWGVPDLGKGMRCPSKALCEAPEREEKDGGEQMGRKGEGQ